MKLHPLSIPYRAVAGSINVGTGVLLATALGSGLDPGSLVFVGTVAVYLLGSLLYQTVYHRRFEYELSSGSFDIHSGVVSRREREIPLGRIQNVDVSQNPIQRAMGIAALQIETAGGGETEATLKYVGTDEADRLRRELRRLAREAADGSTATDAEGAGESRGELVFALSNRNLALLSLFTIDPGAGVVSSILGALASGVDPDEFGDLGTVLEFLPGGRIEAILFGAATVALLTWVLSVALTIARYYGFEIRRTADGLEYERGLFQRFSGTVPIEKVQTVSIRENVLKRRFGYATVAVETAGYSPGQSTRGRQLAVPLAARGEAVDIARSIEPFEGGDFERPPTRARIRYVVRYAIATLLLSGIAVAVTEWLGVFQPVYALAVLVPLAATPVAAHYAWVHRGYRTEADHFVARSGYWRRVTRVVPYYRIQTVVDARTVFQRRRDLASVTADTASSASLVGGDATAIDVDDGDAADLRERLRDRLQESLHTQRAARRRAFERERSGTRATHDDANDRPDDADDGESAPASDAVDGSTDATGTAGSASADGEDPAAGDSAVGQSSENENGTGDGVDGA